MEELTAQELRTRVEDTEGVCIIDVRTPREFQSGHIPGARNIPLNNLEKDALGKAANGKPIVFVCASGTRSKQACIQAEAFEGMDVATLKGGTTAWKAQGYAVSGAGKESMSLERQVRIAAGALVLLGVLCGFLIHTLFFLLSGFVGAGLIFAGITDYCGMGLLLAKMPWNNCSSACQSAGKCD